MLLTIRQYFECDVAFFLHISRFPNLKALYKCYTTYLITYMKCLNLCVGCDQQLTVTPPVKVNVGDSVRLECTSSAGATAEISWSQQPYSPGRR